MDTGYGWVVVIKGVHGCARGLAEAYLGLHLGIDRYLI